MASTPEISYQWKQIKQMADPINRSAMESIGGGGEHSLSVWGMALLLILALLFQVWLRKI